MVTSSEFAAAELAEWEQALADVRCIERQLEIARQCKDVTAYYQLLLEVDALHIRADLLLAKAVEKKRTLDSLSREHRKRNVFTATREA